MTSSNNIVKTSRPMNDEFFLCRNFAKAIGSDRILQVIEKQTKTTEHVVDEIPIENSTSSDNVQMTELSTISSFEDTKWKVGDLCFCPYSEDGLLYKATILNITPSSSSCTVTFDDYGNEEIHALAELQIRTEDEPQIDMSPMADEPQIIPPPPSFPLLNQTQDNDSLSATLMSWYLAGYHTGFYQGLKEK